MASETGNTYISETETDSNDITMSNLGFEIMDSLKKVASDCDSN